MRKQHVFRCELESVGAAAELMGLVGKANANRFKDWKPGKLLCVGAEQERVGDRFVVTVYADDAEGHVLRVLDQRRGVLGSIAARVRRLFAGPWLKIEPYARVAFPDRLEPVHS